MAVRIAKPFRLTDQIVDHGAPVSFLVSSSHGLGMTEGWAEIGDDKTRIRIEVDRATAPLLGLLTHRQIGGSLFCQFVLSALELDETRKPAPYRDRPAPLPFCAYRMSRRQRIINAFCNHCARSIEGRNIMAQRAVKIFLPTEDDRQCRADQPRPCAISRSPGST